MKTPIVIFVVVLVIATAAMVVLPCLCRVYPIYDMDGRGLVFTMTTVPHRMSRLYDSVGHLCRGFPRAKFVLNIPHFSKRFNTSYPEIPQNVARIPNVVINRCEDMGPITKLLPTLSLTKSRDLIMSLDDDVRYSEQYVRRLLRHAKPNTVVGVDFLYVDDYSVPEGASIVLYPRSIFTKKVIRDLKLYHTLGKCFTCDDFVITHVLDNAGVPKMKVDVGRADHSFSLYDPQGLNKQGHHDTYRKCKMEIIARDFERLSYKKPTKIQKIIHQIGPKDRSKWPKEWVDCQKTWKALYPDYKYMMWTDEEDIDRLIAEDFPFFKSIFKAYPKKINRIDAVRPFILYKYGGIYADLDFECLGRIESHLDHTKLNVVESPYKRNEHVQNSLMASSKGHEGWLNVFKQLLANKDENSVLKCTGPQLLSDVYFKHGDTMHVLPAVRFNPASPEIVERDGHMVDAKFYGDGHPLTRHLHTSVWNQ